MKQDFPIFQAHPDLVYLDNAATTQKPQVVIDAITNFYTKSNANIGRSVCGLGDEATNLYEQARQTVQQFLNARHLEEIIFTRSTTESINLIASVLTETFEPEDEIILTELEHHSNLIPWQIATKRKDLKLKFIPILESGQLDFKSYQKLFSAKTKLVAFSHLSNVLGVLNDAQEIISIAKEHGALTLIDGAQAASKIQVDVQELDCDFYAFSGHKIYGPTGIGVLYGKKDLLEKLPAYQTGGKTIDQVWLEDSTLTKLPEKYEAGTPNIAGAIGLAAALGWMKGIQSTPPAPLDRGEMGAEQSDNESESQAKLSPFQGGVGGGTFRHEKQLTDYVEERLLEIAGIKIFGEIGQKLGVISFVIDRIHSLDLATYLAGQGICLRSGHHCAQPLMKKLGVDTTLRISLGVYNDQVDVDYFVEKLERAVGILR